jgi:hypothetical protein
MEIFWIERILHVVSQHQKQHKGTKLSKSPLGRSILPFNNRNLQLLHKRPNDFLHVYVNNVC